jgi:hypothetical protein
MCAEIKTAFENNQGGDLNMEQFSELFTQELEKLKENINAIDTNAIVQVSHFFLFYPFIFRKLSQSPKQSQRVRIALAHKALQRNVHL